MDLATMIINWQLVIMQVLVLIGLTILVQLGKRAKLLKKYLKLTPLDLWPPFLILAIYQLTSNQAQGSFVPHVLLGWIIVSLAVLSWRIFVDQRLTYRKSAVMLWRIADLWFVVAWLFIIFLGLFL
ncbi:DUF3397 family protein [Lentilactobacillus kosonis]|uniref:DUF3397 domain-containing protein n=1 Tax=Lentilactobacillus kosonis TaxID=2810561 RepID=A0A401FP58_9LACO|nr:DUF3397 family protein [Lentilactobacillus kosonis]GAY74058.1 hypothetical protein NBRC111893_2204 [Lentilactobacillus kosonis]